jgi:HEAT repeat protein
MKKLPAVVIASVLAFSAFSALVAGVSLAEWEKAEKKFRADFKNKAGAAKAAAELALVQDVRAAKLLYKDALFHEEQDIYEAAINGLAKTQEPDSIKFLATELGSERKTDNKIILARLMTCLPKGPEVSKRLIYALHDKSEDVNLFGIMAARVQGDKELAPEIQKLASSANPRVAFEAARAVFELTGQWPLKFSAPAAGMLFPDKIHAKETLFIIDVSEDMGKTFIDPEAAAAAQDNGSSEKKEPKKEPKAAPVKEDAESKAAENKISRYSFVARHVKKALRSINPDCEVNLLLFSGGARLFSKKPVKCEPKFLDEADSWLDKQILEPGRDLAKAVRRGMEIAPAADTIYIITCGLPWVDKNEDLDKIRFELRKSVRYRFATVNVIGIFSENPAPLAEENALKKAEQLKKTEAFLKALADDHAGEYVSYKSVGIAPPAPPKPKDKPLVEVKPEDLVQLRPKKVDDTTFKKAADRLKGILKKKPSAEEAAREISAFSMNVHRDTAKVLFEEALKSSDTTLQYAAVDALLNHSEESGVAFLGDRLHFEKDWKLKTLLAEILGSCPFAESEKWLAEQLKTDTQWQVRLAAARGLKSSKTPEAKTALEAALKDKHAAVALEVARSLKNLTGSAPKGFEEEMFDDCFPKTFYSADAAFIFDISEGMSFGMSDPDAREVLRIYLEALAAKKAKESVPPEKEKPKEEKKKDLKAGAPEGELKPPEPVSRLTYAARRIAAALERMNADAFFNMVAAGDQPKYLWKEPAGATADNRKKAADFAASKRVFDTDRRFFGALEGILQDGKTDSIFLIIAAPPLGGEKEFADALRTVKNLNRTALVKINVVYIGAIADFHSLDKAGVIKYKRILEETAAKLRPLAEENNGYFAQVDSFWEENLISSPESPEGEKKPPEGAEKSAPKEEAPRQPTGNPEAPSPAPAPAPSGSGEKTPDKK